MYSCNNTEQHCLLMSNNVFDSFQIIQNKKADGSYSSNPIGSKFWFKTDYIFRVWFQISMSQDNNYDSVNSSWFVSFETNKYIC